MPSRPDVVVVGAGIVGLATAFFLSKGGARVLVLEREAIGCAASGTAAGMISPFTEADGSSPIAQFAREGLRLHQAMAPFLAEETGIDVHFGPLTVLEPAFAEPEAAELRERPRPADAIARWLDGSEARDLEPRLSPKAIGALLPPLEAMVDAYRLTLALAQAAERLGTVVRHGRVTGLIREGRRVRGVTIPGERILADQVVLAAGPWSGGMAGWVGFPIPVTPLRGQLLHLQVPDPLLRCCLIRRGNYVLLKGDGVTIAGTTEEAVGFRPQPTRAGQASVMAAVLRLAPSLQEATAIRQTACLRPLSADGLPLLGRAPGWDGLYVATGHGRRGILLSLISGRTIADLVLEGREHPLLAAFAPGRFASTVSGQWAVGSGQ